MTVDEYLAAHGHELPDLAKTFADWESNAARRDQTGGEYVGAIEWRRDVALAYGFGPRLLVRRSCDEYRRGVVAAGLLPIGCAGRSTDRRGWTMFIRGDVRRLPARGKKVCLGARLFPMGPAEKRPDSTFWSARGTVERSV